MEERDSDTTIKKLIFILILKYLEAITATESRWNPSRGSWRIGGNHRVSPSSRGGGVAGAEGWGISCHVAGASETETLEQLGSRTIS